MDIKRTGYHRCDKMPSNEFIEKQLKGWHIHRTDMKHGDYSKELQGDMCPYCGEQLKEFDK